jgi:hypothetical protein
MPLLSRRQLLLAEAEITYGHRPDAYIGGKCPLGAQH